MANQLKYIAHEIKTDEIFAINKNNILKYVGRPILKETFTEEVETYLNSVLDGLEDYSIIGVGDNFLISKKTKSYLDPELAKNLDILVKKYSSYEFRVDESISNVYFEFDSRMKEMEAISQYMEMKMDAIEDIIKKISSRNGDV